jgi:acyl-coenzyme A thioesterase PaaI-like protein
MFVPIKPTSFRMRLYGFVLNFFPTYRRTGGRATFIAADFSDVHIRLKLGWGTKNYVGTMFGGSMTSAADPVYMIQLMQLLGKDYVVWDKSAHIQFKRPGDRTLYIRFLITDELLANIKERVLTEQEFDIELSTNWVDKEGTVYAKVSKVLYIASKAFYKEKQQNRKKIKEKS